MLCKTCKNFDSKNGVNSRIEEETISATTSPGRDWDLGSAMNVFSKIPACWFLHGEFHLFLPGNYVEKQGFHPMFSQRYVFSKCSLKVFSISLCSVITAFPIFNW